MTLGRNTVWTVFGGMAHAAYQCGVMLAIARFSSVEAVGRYVTGVAIATPLSIFADRALRTIQATADDDLSVAHYLGFRVLIGIGSAAATCFILTFSGFSLLTCQVVLLVTLLRLVEGVAQVLYGRMHRHEQMGMIGCSQAVRAMLSLAGVALTMLLTARLDLALLVAILLSLGVVACLDLRLVRRLPDLGSSVVTVSIGQVPWRHLASLTVPLGSATFLVSLNTSLPRYWVSQSHGEATVGVFSVLCYTCFPAMMIVTAVTQAAMPKMARLHRDGDFGQLRRLLLQLISVGLLTAAINGIVLLTLGDSLLSWLLGAESAAASTSLPWVLLAVSAGFVATVPATALTAQRRFRAAVITCLLSTTTCVLTGIWAIHRYAIDGAAWTLLATAVMQAVTSWVALRTVTPPQTATTGGWLPFRPAKSI